MPRVSTTNIITNPKRYGYDFRIGNLLLRSATGPDRQMVIQSSDVQGGQAVNVKQNPEDFTSNLGRIYSRNKFDAGQGLDTAHRANGQPDDINRFWDSKGIDVFHGDDETSYHIHLLYTTAAKSLNFSGTNNYITRTTNGNLYITDVQAVYESTDNGDTWTAMTGTGITKDITGIAHFGNDLYITTATGTTGNDFLHYQPGGHGWAVHNTAFSGGLTGVWFVKNTLFVTGNDGTAEYIWEGNPFDDSWASDFNTSDSIIEVEPTHQITSVIDAGAVVLVGSTDGNVYSLKLVSGTFVNQGQSTIPFEMVYSLSANEGIIFLGTKQDGGNTTGVGRFYRADLVASDDLYVLANRQLIKEWVITGIDATPKAMFASRDSIYVGIKEATNEVNLWQYYLPTGGFARSLQTAGNGFVSGITQQDSKFIIVVEGSDVYKETSTYENTGYLITSAADFYTAESKQFVGAEVSTFPIVNNTNVELRFSTNFEDLDSPESNNYELALKLTSGSGDEEKQISPVSRYIIGKIILNSTDGVNSPKVKSLQFRALARPELVVAQIPVNISDRVERPGRKPIKVRNLGNTLYQELRQLEGDAVTLEIFDPNEIIRGVIEQISYPIQENVERGSVTQYALITVRGTRQPVVTSVSSINVFGVGALGQMRFGG